MKSFSNYRYLIGGIILFLVSISYVKKTFEIMKNGERLTEIRKEVAGYSKKKSVLEAEIEYMQSTEYIEKSARTELNMVKPNELVFVPENSLKTDSNDPAQTLIVESTGSVSNKKSQQQASRVGKWIKYFWY